MMRFWILRNQISWTLNFLFIETYPFRIWIFIFMFFICYWPCFYTRLL